MQVYNTSRLIFKLKSEPGMRHHFGGAPGYTFLAFEVPQLARNVAKKRENGQKVAKETIRMRNKVNQ